MTSLYARLGVPSTASADEIRAAYRARARELHPDRQGSGATRDMAELNDAWRVLSDPAARRAYDAGMFEAPRGATVADAEDPINAPSDWAESEDEEWPAWDPEGADPRGRVLRWMIIVVTVVVALALIALFLYAFTASPEITDNDDARATYLAWTR
jgi:curved DNA-binding protein CbpA